MRKILFSTLTAAALATSACGGDSGTGPADVSVSGMFALKAVNATSLPYTMPDDGSGLGTVVILAERRVSARR